jgi:hypothetical protein
MKRATHPLRRIAISLDEIGDTSLAALKGTPLDVCNGWEKFGESYNAHEPARQRAIVFEEALHALEEFAAKHGYIPRQPRFAVMVNEDGTPARPRRHERCEEMRAVEDALALAQKQADGKADDR